jgi:hypothetical protein
MIWHEIMSAVLGLIIIKMIVWLFILQHKAHGEIMSTFTDLAAALDALAGEVAIVKADVEKLLVRLAAIPALSAEQQAQLDAAVTHAQAISATLAAADAAVNPAPAAPVA